MIRIAFISSFLFLLISCSKNNGGSDDKQAPTIQFNSPANNQVFSAGQSINISAMITDNDKIAETHVHIYNNSTAALIEDIHSFPAAASFSLNESFTAQAGISYKIQLVAIDRSGNQQIQTVIVSVN